MTTKDIDRKILEGRVEEIIKDIQSTSPISWAMAYGRVMGFITLNPQVVTDKELFEKLDTVLFKKIQDRIYTEAE